MAASGVTQFVTQLDRGYATRSAVGHLGLPNWAAADQDGATAPSPARLWSLLVYWIDAGPVGVPHSRDSVVLRTNGIHGHSACGHLPRPFRDRRSWKGRGSRALATSSSFRFSGVFLNVADSALLVSGRRAGEPAQSSAVRLPHMGQNPATSSTHGGKVSANNLCGQVKMEKVGNTPKPPLWKRTKVRIAAGATAVLTIVGTAALIKLADTATTTVLGKVVELNVDTGGPILNVEAAQGMDCSANGWIYPYPPSSELMQSPPGTGQRNNGKTWDQDPAAFGAVPAGPVRLFVSATGKSQSAVILTGIDFHLDLKRPPVVGTGVNLASGCGGAGIYHAAAISFAEKPPYWVPTEELPEGLRADPLKFPYTVTTSDPSLFLISVRPDGCDCKWHAVLHWISGSTAGTTTINDHGHPFETTSSKGIPLFYWQGSERQAADLLNP
jgi:hypothetical protein